MRELKESWTNLGELTRKQKILIFLIIILTATVAATLTIAIPKYFEMRCEADWAYSEAVKLQKENGGPVEETKGMNNSEKSDSKTVSQ